MKSWETYPKEVCMKKALKLLKDKEVDVGDMMLDEIDDSIKGMTSEDWRKDYNKNIIPRLQLTAEEWGLIVYVFKYLV